MNKKYPIRVLQVIRAMNIGGAETLIMNLYRNIDRKKVQFDFLVSYEGYFDDEIKKLGGNIHYIPYLTDKGQITYEKNIIKLLKAHPEYQVIHSHIDQVSGIIMQAAKKAGVSVRISHSHSTSNNNGKIAKIYKGYLQSKINKNANNYFACSKEAASWLFKEKSKEAVIINNGIDIDKFKFSQEKRDKIRKELNIPEDYIVVGHVGAFRKEKNHIKLIQLYNEYLKENPKSVLVSVGDGDLKNNIIEEVKNLGIENNVKFLGLRSDTDALYSAFDILLFPSLYEGLSICLLEAQTSGLKILTSDTVDKNIKLTDNIEFLSLEENNWNKYFKTNKDRTYNKNLDKFDIKNIAKEYQKFIESK